PGSEAQAGSRDLPARLKDGGTRARTVVVQIAGRGHQSHPPGATTSVLPRYWARTSMTSPWSCFDGPPVRSPLSAFAISVSLVKIYNALGLATLAFHALLSVFLAPTWLGPWRGLAVGSAYLFVSWFVCGVYLSDIIHMGIAHRALDYKERF